ncbi:MAG: hypothetical protein KAX49_16890 [Halanaerobiales bacterium]|nr:hypothetical protein [Halanaerobiales bacterium]
MSNVENLLQKILENQVKMQSDINDLKTNQERFEKKLDAVANQVADLTEFKAETTDMLIKMDEKIDQIKFVKHKAFRNKEDLFNLKQAFKYTRNPEQV